MTKSTWPWIWTGKRTLKYGSPEYSAWTEMRIARSMGITLKELDEAHGFRRPGGYNAAGNIDIPEFEGESA